MLNELLTEYGKTLTSILAPSLTWLTKEFFAARAKIAWGFRSKFTFLIQQPLYKADGSVLSPTQTVNTHSIVIINFGKKTSKNVEINWKPEHFNIWPLRHYEIKPQNDGRFVIIFDSLTPKERINFELLAVNNNLPAVTNVRSDECVAREFDFESQIVLKRWFISGVQILMFLGACLVAYGLISLLKFLVLTVPSR